MTFAFVCASASASTSPLALSGWKCKRKCREWVPHPFSVFDANTDVTCKQLYLVPWNPFMTFNIDASANVTCKQTLNKKVLLHEHKRHTTHRIAFAHYAALSNGGEVPHPVLVVGVPGVPPSRPGQGVPQVPPPPSRPWMGYPQPRPEMGYPLPRHPDQG